MEKLKLSEKQKYCLLQDACCDIVSQGCPYHFFLSPYDCDSIKFNVGAFSRKNGCRVEVVYTFNTFTIRLLWHYVKKSIMSGIVEDYVFVPKALTIEREFKGSILISIVPDIEGTRYYYQSTKSIYDLCVGDSEEGEGVAVGLGSVCLAGESGDSPLPNESKHSVAKQTFL